MVLSSMTGWEATSITLPLYSVNLLMSSIHQSLKQWWLRKSLPKMKGLIMPLHTTNLCIKIQDPILKLIITDPLTPTSWPLTVLMHVLLSDIWCKRPISAMVSCLMQLTEHQYQKEMRIQDPLPLFWRLYLCPSCVYEKYLFFHCTVAYICILVVFC